MVKETSKYKNEYDHKYHILYNKFYKRSKVENCRIYECEGYIDYARMLYSDEIKQFKNTGVWRKGRRPIWFHKMIDKDYPPVLIINRGEFNVDFS